MKKLIALILAAMLLLPAFALADTSAETTEVAEAAETENAETETEATEAQDVIGYQIDNETNSLVVRMDMNSDESYSWSYNIDDESLLQEINDTTEDVPGKWIAGFMPASEDASGAVVLRLYNAQDGVNVETDSAYTVSVYMTIDNGSITVTGILENAVNWVTNMDGESINVTLPANATTGYEWTYAVDNADMFTFTENYTEDEKADEDLVGVGGTWTLDIVPTKTGAGDATIDFSYARSFEDADPAETHSLTLSVSDEGSVSITSASCNYTETETVAE